jgi:hypothetical protein
MDEESISLRKFAKSVNATEGAVRKAIKSGKITNAAIDRSGIQPRIYPTKARADWSSNYAPNVIQNESLAGELMEGEDSEIETDDAGEIIIPADASFAEQARIEKHYKALTARQAVEVGHGL